MVCLASSVPQLDGDVPVVHPDRLHLEVHPQGRAQVGHEHPLGDPVDEGGLPHGGVPGEHHLVGPVRRPGGLKVPKLAALLLSVAGIVEYNIHKNNFIYLKTPAPKLEFSGITRVRDFVLLLLP